MNSAPTNIGPATWLLQAAFYTLWWTALSGCRVGPEYARPAVPTSAAWLDSANPHLLEKPGDDVLWWTAFDDPALNQLVEEVRQENPSLRQAGTRILEARATLGVVQGNLGPQDQAALGGIKHTHISHNSPNQALASILRRNDFDQWTLGFGAAWEADVWGRFRRSVSSAGAELDASIENFHDVSVILSAETARAYIELRTLENRLALAQQNVAIQKETLELTEMMARVGKGSDLDVLQARSNLCETKALLPSLQDLHRRANNHLCVLLGSPPSDLRSKLGHTARIPVPPADLAVGVPADLLRRRPDIRRVERQLAAQSERIGIAASEFYPHLTISANVGLDALDLSKLYSPRSLAAVAGPSFRWNILNYGRIQNGVHLHEARYQGLIYEYQAAVLKADEEAENAIVHFLKTHEQVALREQSVAAAQKSVDDMLVAYRAGWIDFHRLFLLETQLVVKQDTLSTARGELALSLVAVYRAMGGGWEPSGQSGPVMQRLPPVEEAGKTVERQTN